MKKIIKTIFLQNIYLDHFYQFSSSFFNYKKIKNYPFGKVNKHKRDDYLNLFDAARNQEYKEVVSFEKRYEHKINKNWLNNLALVTQVTIKNSEICYAHGRILYTLLSHQILKINEKIQIIETGTSKGFSSLCMAKALNDLDKEGNIHTIDILPKDKKIFWNSISDFEGTKNRFKLLENWKNLIEKHIKYYEGFSKNILKDLSYLKRIHFAFLDGSHTYLDVKFELEFVAKRQKKNDMIVIDDYNKQYPGLVKATNNFLNNFNYSIELINSSKNRTYAICKKI